MITALLASASLAVGCIIGARYTAAGHHVDRLVEAFDRDCSVLDAADIAIDSVL